MPTETKDLSWQALLPPIFAAAGIDPGPDLTVEPLTGGVSSDIVRIVTMRSPGSAAPTSLSPAPHPR